MFVSLCGFVFHCDFPWTLKPGDEDPSPEKVEINDSFLQFDIHLNTLKDILKLH